MRALGTSIQDITSPSVQTERRAAMKARLMSAALAQQPTQTAPAVSSNGSKASAAEPVTLPARIRPIAEVSATTQRGWAMRAMSMLQRPLWVTAAAAALIIGLMWWGSARALPDDPLYAVKLAAETLQTGFGRTVAEETRTHISLANSRLRDLRTMQSRADLPDAGAALISYRDHLGSSSVFWKQTTGNERTDLARLLYGSTLAGQETFGSLGNLTATLPTSV